MKICSSTLFVIVSWALSRHCRISQPRLNHTTKRDPPPSPPLRQTVFCGALRGRRNAQWPRPVVGRSAAPAVVYVAVAAEESDRSCVRRTKRVAGVGGGGTSVAQSRFDRQPRRTVPPPPPPQPHNNSIITRPQRQQQQKQNYLL